jgi:ABC-type amino acid transport system permease subunit
MKEKIISLLREPYRKPWLWIILTIVLGAIGSGLWDSVIKPSTTFLMDTGITIGTLGVKSFQEDIYKEIAKGHHERLSLSILNIIIGVMIGLILGVFTIKHSRRKKKDEPEDAAKKRTRSFIIVLYLIFSSVFLLVHNVRSIYINRSITYYNQLFVISSPYISEQDRLSVASRFGQIQNSQDYDRIIAELAAIITGHGQTLPKK